MGMMVMTIDDYYIVISYLGIPTYLFSCSVTTLDIFLRTTVHTFMNFTSALNSTSTSLALDKMMKPFMDAITTQDVGTFPAAFKVILVEYFGSQYC